MRGRKRKKKERYNCKAVLQMVRVDGFNPQNSRKETAFVWTDVYEKNAASSSATGCRGVSLICSVLHHCFNLFSSGRTVRYLCFC